MVGPGSAGRETGHAWPSGKWAHSGGRADELSEHYSFDYGKGRPNRFAARLGEETIAVVLDPDVAAVFTTSEEANQALRVLIGALGNLAETSDLLEKIRSGGGTVPTPSA